MKIILPAEVLYIIETLRNNGYQAYPVGGCVRDALLGSKPADWDICTSALSAEIKTCFAKHKLIETGIKHGTITLLLANKPYEITAYRLDGPYDDNRHPRRVEYINDLKTDLARRDFTVNALAYDPDAGLIDYFGGGADLQNGIIRCVGNAQQRFQEDGLRIMRALRFAATLGFEIETSTAEALLANRALLSNISAERIIAELNKLLSGKNVETVMLDYRAVFAVIIPELEPLIGFEQNSRYHHLDVYQHTICSVSNAPADPLLRLTLLLHDIAKPACYSQVEMTGHFYGHSQVGTEIARRILRRLKYDKRTVETVCELIKYHDTELLATDKNIKHWLNKLGLTTYRQLLAVKRADSLAHAQAYQNDRLTVLDEILPLIEKIVATNQCFSLRDLAINGHDLLALSIPPGKELGMILRELLSQVISGTLVNQKPELIARAGELYKKFLQ